MYKESHFVFPGIEFIRDDSVVFPKQNISLKHKEKATIQIDPKKVHIYKLDWAWFDNQLKKRFNSRKRSRRMGVSKKYEPALPQKYEDMLNKMEFAIDREYMAEISRNIRRGVEEWCVDRPFDTNVREHCLNPGIAHIDTAFYLLDDCLYDSKTQYWFDHDTTIKAIAKCAMLYKFWTHQTGGGLIWSLSKADNLLKGPGPTNLEVLEFLDELTKKRQQNIKLHIRKPITTKKKSP